MKPTLAKGWEAFAADLVKKPAYRQTQCGSYRQAYKNGVASVLARGAVRGVQALTVYLRASRQDPIDAARVLRDIILPMWANCRLAHEDWGDLHCRACIAGGLSAMTLLLCGADLSEIKTELRRWS
jgi:hypothetical protein